MWKQFVQNISADYHFNPPATTEEIMQITKKLNVELPNDLLNLFRETNGVFDEFNCPLIWSTNQIGRMMPVKPNFDSVKMRT
jgi:cell wall assembly regulator SMI1